MSKRVDAKISEAIVGDVNEVAKMLSCDVGTVLRDHAGGLMPASMTVGDRIVWSLAEIKQWVAAKCPDRRVWERLTSKSRIRPARRKPAREAQFLLPHFGKLQIPTAGKSVFVWAKQMEKVFETEVVAEMVRYGEFEGYSKIFADWSQQQINKICTKVINRLYELPTQCGEFNDLFPDEES